MFRHQLFMRRVVGLLLACAIGCSAMGSPLDEKGVRALSDHPNFREVCDQHYRTGKTKGPMLLISTLHDGSPKQIDQDSITQTRTHWHMRRIWDWANQGGGGGKPMSEADWNEIARLVFAAKPVGKVTPKSLLLLTIVDPQLGTKTAAYSTDTLPKEIKAVRSFISLFGYAGEISLEKAKKDAGL